MSRRVTAMIHVPDVQATVQWYIGVGFSVMSTNEHDGVVDWALLSYGEGRIMFTAGGAPSGAERREVDVYVNVDDVDETYARLRGVAQIREELHETFYGMREFIVRDPNGFWVTFGSPSR